MSKLEAYQPEPRPLLPPEMDRAGWLRRARSLLETIDGDADMLRTVDHRLAARLLRVGVRDSDAVTAWMGYRDFRAADRRWEIREDSGLRQTASSARPQIAAWGRAMAIAGARSGADARDETSDGDRASEAIYDGSGEW